MSPSEFQAQFEARSDPTEVAVDNAKATDVVCTECHKLEAELFFAEDGALYCQSCFLAWYGHPPPTADGSDATVVGLQLRPAGGHEGWQDRQEPLPGGMRVIPLGAWCVVREMGLLQELMPFDILRSSAEGVMRHLRSNFQDFLRYDYVLEREVEAHHHPQRFPPSLAHQRIFVGRGWSNWFDDLSDPFVKAKYDRRIQRLRRLRRGGDMDSGGPLIFVRAVNATYELAAMPELHSLMVEQFGPRAYLLLMLGHQLSHTVLFFDDRPTLLLHLLGRHRAGGGLRGCQWLWAEAIHVAFRYARSSGARPVGHMSFPSVRDFLLSASGASRLVVDVYLGTDLTKQFAPFPCPGSHELPKALVPGGGPFGFLEALDLKRQGCDVRKSPRDGRLYLFDGFVAAEIASMEHAPEASRVDMVWHEECVPLGSDAPARAEGSEALERVLHSPIVEVLHPDIPPAGEVRRSTYDDHLYDFYGLVRVCGNKYTAEEVEEFWRDECRPVGGDGWGLRDPAEKLPVGELRRNPHDGHVYNFEGLVRVSQDWRRPQSMQAGNMYTQEEIEVFWRDECKPIGPEGGSLWQSV